MTSHSKQLFSGKAGIPRALVVDDHQTNLFVLQAILGDAGVEVCCAQDGAQACELFYATRFDVILMDVQMPIMGGLEAIRRMRAFENARQRPRTPIIVNSCLSEAEDVSLSMQAGADHHLSKPLQIALLLETVRATLAPADQGLSSPPAWGHVYSGGAG